MCSLMNWCNIRIASLSCSSEGLRLWKIRSSKICSASANTSGLRNRNCLLNPWTSATISSLFCSSCMASSCFADLLITYFMLFNSPCFFFFAKLSVVLFLLLRIGRSFLSLSPFLCGTCQSISISVRDLFCIPRRDWQVGAFPSSNSSCISLPLISSDAFCWKCDSPLVWAKIVLPTEYSINLICRGLVLWIRYRDAAKANECLLVLRTESTDIGVKSLRWTFCIQ